LPGARGVAVDISPEALAVATQNAAALGVADRLNLHQGDLFARLKGQTFDAILSNPPYIAAKDMAGLAPEVKSEPSLALDGGADGLDFYRRITAEAAGYLNQDGFVAVEVGAGQAPAVAALAAEANDLKAAATIKDYAGIERVVVLKRR